jgi:hypothetical protein
VVFSAGRLFDFATPPAPPSSAVDGVILSFGICCSSLTHVAEENAGQRTGLLEGYKMKLEKDDIETVRDLDRRRLLKFGSAGALVAITGTVLATEQASAHDSDPSDSYDSDPYDDTDIRNGRTRTRRRHRSRPRRYSDPADSDPYNGADAD